MLRLNICSSYLFILASRIFSSKKEKRCFLFSLLAFVFAVIGVYGAGYRIPYYIVALKFFCTLGWIPFFLLISKVFSYFTSKGLSQFILSYFVFIASATLIISSPAVYKLGTTKEDCPQYRFAAKINSIDDPKVLNYGFLDTGFFMAADVLPFNNHYCMITIDDVYGYEQVSILNEETADYIITNEPYSFENYEMCDAGVYTNINFGGEEYTDTFYLYERAQ